MNTALRTARVGWFGDHYQVTIGDIVTTCKTQRELVTLLTGGRLESDDEKPRKPKPTFETIEAFLERGGVIKKLTRPKAEHKPPPPAVRETPKVAPSRITLEMLFAFKKKPTPPSQT